MSDQLPNKDLGQHWLHDRASLEAICDVAELKQGDTVLEIGPGLGTLTELLIKQAKHVVAVEFDAPLARKLPQHLPADNLDVVHQDILQFDLTTLPPGYKVVANIPYYLTGSLLRYLSEAVNPPLTTTLLVQKEVAERVVASPGNLSILGVSMQFYWQAGLGQVVPAALFTPPPKVDSQILHLRRRLKPLFPDVDPKVFFRIVKAGFAQRRKTLLNSLAAGLQLDREIVTAACLSVDIDPARRAQSLSLEEWHNLYISLNT